LLAIFEIAAFTLSIATTQPLRLYSVAANPKAGFPERRSGIEENATKSAQVGGGLTSAVLDSSGVAGCIRANVLTSIERDLPLNLIRAAIGIFFTAGRILVCHPSRRGSGYSI
jgi:hypothetical protein